VEKTRAERLRIGGLRLPPPRAVSDPPLLRFVLTAYCPPPAAPWKQAPGRDAKRRDRHSLRAPPRRRTVNSRLTTQRIVLTNQLVHQHWTRIVPDC